MNGGQYEERKKQKQAKENKKQAPMDCDCCYRNSCGNFCSMRGRNVGNKGKCLEDTGRIQSQYSNTEGIETEIQLADSGYGQGQVLVNPLHMACIYSAFCNGGNVIKPYLVYQKDAVAEYWIPGAFSNETASRVLEGTKKVVKLPDQNKTYDRGTV